MRLLDWICFLLDWSKKDPDSGEGYFFFDEDTGDIHSI